jgi:hypothetical protein
VSSERLRCVVDACVGIKLFVAEPGSEQLGTPLVTSDAQVAEAVPWADWYEDM